MKNIHYFNKYIKNINYTIYIYLTFGMFIAYFNVAVIAIN